VAVQQKRVRCLEFKRKLSSTHTHPHAEMLHQVIYVSTDFSSLLLASYNSLRRTLS
jgi:hypothetical protein